MSVSNDNESGVVYDSSVPTVSVIMNCLNCERYLKEAIDSVFAQTYEDWEIIFWEDKDSDDNSGEIARSYDYKLRYFKADKKLPLYGARNQAIEKARGKYIAILDCDDSWLPTKLEKQILLFKKDEQVGLVYCDVYSFNEKGKEKRLFGSKKPYRGNIFSELLLHGFIYTPTVLIKKDVFGSSKALFDKRLKMSGDYDAYLRISHKWKVDYVDEPLARYRVHTNNMTSKDGRRLIATELDLIVENLKKTIYRFEYKYPKGIRLLKRRRDIQLSFLDWENGDKKKARKRLRTYIHDSMSYFVLYFLMYLPYRYAFNPCYRMYTKNIMAD